MSSWEEALGRPRTCRHVSSLAWECLCVPSDEVEEVGGGQAASLRCINSIHRHGYLSVQICFIYIAPNQVLTTAALRHNLPVY